VNQLPRVLEFKLFVSTGINDGVLALLQSAGCHLTFVWLFIRVGRALSQSVQMIGLAWVVKILCLSNEGAVDGFHLRGTFGYPLLKRRFGSSWAFFHLLHNIDGS